MRLFSIIKNDGPGDVLIWKFTGEDFNNNSQLIVMESEEAIFVKDGIALQVFEGGKYSLSTNNYPFLSRLRNFMSDGISAFNCKVYFVNKAHKLELLWGTDSPVQLRDAEFGFLIGARANGSYSIQVDNAKKFLIKLVGNNVQSFTREEVNKYFRTAFVMHIKTKLATVMKQMKMTVFDMATEYVSISQELFPVLQEIMDEYGVRLVNFYINSISVPENDPNYEAVNKAYQKKAEITIQGQDWSRLTSKELLKDVANNPGSGGISNMGAGIGLGIGTASVFSNLTNQLITPISSQQKEQHQPTQQNSRYKQKQSKEDVVECPKCKSMNPKTSKFCSECGAKLVVEKKKCPHCSAKVPETSKFCSECGEKL